MEGNQGYEDSSLSSDHVGSGFSYDYGDYTKQLFSMDSGMSENQSRAQSLSQWIHCPKAPHSYVEFLTENLEKVPTADMLESIGSPISGRHAVDGISEIQEELLHTNGGKSLGSRPDHCSLELGAGKSQRSAYTHSSYNHKPAVESVSVQQFKFPMARSEGQPVNFTSPEYQTYVQQNGTFWAHELNGGTSNVFQVHPTETISTPSFVSQPHCTVPRRRYALTYRERRSQVSERLRALQELLPNPVESNQASVLDNIIDQIKFLQLQLKELSRSRLGGESISDPFIFLEGFGHYILHGQMSNESLEEMMASLFEMNPSAATQLLESRGLYMMPMALVEGLQRMT